MVPKISVVVPCYNVERYVRQCVKSALDQTLDDIEVICVNDGSTDGTLAVLQELAEADSRIRIIDKENEGYGKTMNKGFDAATGEYIAILESDDFIDENMLEDHYRIAKENGSLDVVKSNFFFYWSKPEELDEFCDLIGPEECGRVFRPFDERHIFYVKPSIWSAIYRADFIRDNGIRFNETPGASYQDASFNFQVWLHAKRVQFIRRAYLHYRQDNESSSVNSPGKVYCVCDEYEKIFEALSAYPDRAESDDLVGMVVKMKFDSYMWNYERLTSELGGEFLKRVVDEFNAHIENEEIDWSLFDGYKTLRLKEILDDPVFYHLLNSDDSDQPSKLRTLRRYWKAGGIGYVVKLMKTKR